MFDQILIYCVIFMICLYLLACAYIIICNFRLRAIMNKMTGDIMTSDEYAASLREDTEHQEFMKRALDMVDEDRMKFIEQLKCK